MDSLDDYFRKESDGLEHPRLRRWSAFLNQPHASADMEVVRPRKGIFDEGPVVIYVNLKRPGYQAQQDTDSWSDELHRGLVKLHVRAINDENEALRFALAFPGEFEPVEDGVGEGFFNAVLREVVEDAPFAASLAGVLREFHVPAPDHDSPRYPECRERVDRTIRARARELRHDLRYEQPRAERILVAALAQYLDDRFSITSRRQLFGR